ncbi:glycosyltransferase family 4 protein [Niallia hominis]|uniref:Glycosyltransferase family 4 protein n=1 Tax=Niallia hominis TaxID=3133173 RepID=A0ABV1EUK0_9BACI
MNKILILANNDAGLYKFRKELIYELVNNYEVYISLPNGPYIKKLKDMGCKFVNTQINRRGTNPISDLKLLLKYKSIIKEIRPSVVLTYTIKPNIYGGLACRLARAPYIANITGLGTAIENKGILQKISLFLYKIGLKNSSCVFFQNDSNKQFFLKKELVKEKVANLIPGSGVNLKQYSYEKYPDDEKTIRLLYIGRLMKAKGIEELLKASEKVKKLYPNVYFELIGASEEDYTKRINELCELGIIKYHGEQGDVRPFIKNSHSVILPSYHEGTSNVLLESASLGRPILASKVPGCIETFDEGVSGFGFKTRSEDSLVEVIERFINLSYEEKEAMGKAGRIKMEKEFDRNIVIDAYMNEIVKIMKKEI